MKAPFFPLFNRKPCFSINHNRMEHIDSNICSLPSYKLFRKPFLEVIRSNNKTLAVTLIFLILEV